MILSLKKVFALGVAVALLGVISVYGMQSLVSVKQVVPAISAATNPPLELRLELTKTEFQQGEPINITGSLKNIGNTSIAITIGNRGGRIIYEVYDTNGTKVHILPLTLSTALDRFSLEPNEQVSQTYTWNQISLIYDSEFYQKQVPKGTYTIIAKTQNYIAIENVRIQPFQTPPITIAIK